MPALTSGRDQRPRHDPGRSERTVLVLALTTLGGAASATQSAVNGELGVRLHSAPLAALTNNLVGSSIILVGLLAMPSMRRGLIALRRARLPWWAYLGGAGGASFVAIAAYAAPVIGVAVFTIAQVTGASYGGLAVDRVGLAPTGRLPLSRSRIAGAALAVVAVAIAQAGRPIGNLPLGLLALAVGGGIAVALQSALNGRVSQASAPATATLVNFGVATPVIAALVALTGGFTSGWPDAWPGEWYLYLGGVLGVAIVTILVLAVRVLGVLRSNLAMIAGQLGGAVLLDAVIPGGARPALAVVVGALLTVAAVVIAGWHGRRGRPVADLPT